MLTGYMWRCDFQAPVLAAYPSSFGLSETVQPPANALRSARLLPGICLD